jgi:hypothetical protein
MIDFNTPWEYDHTFRAIFDASGTTVTFLPTRHDPARARLLLAAPALHVALKELLDYTINRLYGGDYEMGTNVELDAPIAALGMVEDIMEGGTDREEYPDHGPTDPSATSGPGGGT